MNSAMSIFLITSIITVCHAADESKKPDTPEHPNINASMTPEELKRKAERRKIIDGWTEQALAEMNKKQGDKPLNPDDDSTLHLGCPTQ